MDDDAREEEGTTSWPWCVRIPILAASAVAVIALSDWCEGGESWHESSLATADRQSVTHLESWIWRVVCTRYADGSQEVWSDRDFGGGRWFYEDLDGDGRADRARTWPGGEPSRIFTRGSGDSPAAAEAFAEADERLAACVGRYPARPPLHSFRESR